MDKEKFVSELIANEASQFEEEDKSWLTALDEKQLEKLSPGADAGSGDGGYAGSSANVKVLEAKLVEKDEEIKTLTAASKAKDGGTKEGVAPVAKKDPPQTVEDYIAAAPTGMQEVLNSGIRAHNSRRTELVSQIKANAKSKFEDTVLAAFPLETLENLAALAVTDDYSTRGGPRFNEVDPNAIPMPEPVFDLSPKSASNGASKE